MFQQKVHQQNPSNLDGVPDLCQLLYLAEPNVLHNLEHRYARSKIYTSTTAKVLIAVNPYEKIAGSDSDATMAKYEAAEINLEGLLTAQGLEPHVFTVAHAAYHNMVAKQTNQSVIVCGESGSGKTESAKLFMKFLAYTSTATSSEPKEFMEAQSIGNQVLDANPILESFGNAKTVLNNNSSRFGKFTKMLFNPRQGESTCSLVGAAIETYLLEKSRVVRQDSGERNYHIFYLLCTQAASNPNWSLGDGNPENFNYLNVSGCTTFDGDSSSDAKDYKILVDAMNTLQIGQDEQQKVFSTVAGILHLGNVEFAANGEECSVVDESVVASTAKLFQVDKASLMKRLVSRTITVMGKCIVKPLTKTDADNNRDSIAKALYNGLFLWVVQRINQQSMAKGNCEDYSWIGTLDVFGFEIFENNSFEQFCINFANERLQSFFNFNVLKAEQDLYKREALLWTHIDLPENQDVIDLIMGRPTGVFSVLDSTGLQPQGNAETFTHNLFSYNKDNPRLTRINHSPVKRRKGSSFNRVNGFVISHYAGDVHYDAKEFLIKNNDSTHPDTCSLFQSSKDDIVARLLGTDQQKNADTKRRASMTFTSVSSVFSRQLESLMKTLKQTQPYFVRCIKPNMTKAPREFVEEYVQPQLRCGGLIEALRIIKCGFPTRCSYERLHEQFGSALKGFGTPHNLNKRDFAEGLIKFCGCDEMQKSEYQLGLTMIFFRPGKQAFFQKLLDMRPESISASQKSQIHKWLIHKRMVRMCGSIKAYCRLHHFRNWLRIAKAARIMNVIGKTMFRVLRKVRVKLGHKYEEEERAKMLQNKAYLDALASQEKLKAMQAAEAQWKTKLAFEKEAALKAQSDLQNSHSAMKDLMEKVKVANSKIAELESQASQEQSDKAAFTEQLRQSRLELQQYTEQVEKLTTQQKKDKTEYSALISELEAEKEAVLRQNKVLQNSLEQESSSMAQEIVVLTEKFEQAKADARRAEANSTKSMASKEDEANALRSELAGLEQEKRKLGQQLVEAESDLERERSNSTMKQDGLQRDLSSAQDKVQRLSAQLEEKTNELFKLNAKFKDTELALKNDGDEKENQLKNLQFLSEQQIKTLQTDLDNSKVEAQKLKEKLAALRSSSEDRESELEEEIQALKAAHRETCEELNQQIREKESRLAQVSTQLSLLQSQYEATHSETASRLNGSEERLRRMKSEHDELNAELQRRISELESECSDAKHKNSKLEEDKSNLHEVEQSLRAKEVQLTSTISLLTSEGQQAQESFQSKLNAQHQDCLALKQAQSKLILELEQAKTDAQAESLRMKHKESQHLAKIEELECSLEDERKQSQGAMSKLKRSRAEHDEELQDAHFAEMTRLKHKLSELSNELYEHEQHIEKLARTNAKLTTSNASTKNDLEFALEEVSSWKARQLETEKALKEKIKKLTEEMVSSEKAAEATQQQALESAAKLSELSIFIEKQQGSFDTQLANELEQRELLEQELERAKGDLEVANERLELYQRSNEENVKQMDSELEAERENTRALKTMHRQEISTLRATLEGELDGYRAQWQSEKRLMKEKENAQALEYQSKRDNKAGQHRGEMARLKQTNTNLVCKAEGLQEDVKLLQEQLRNKDTMNQALDATFAEQQQATLNAIAELSQKYEKIATEAQAENDRFQEMHDKAKESLRRDLAAAQEEKTTLFCENMRLQKQYDQMKRYVGGTKAQLEAMHKAIQENAAAQIKSLKQTYKRQIAHLEEKVDQLMRELCEAEMNGLEMNAAVSPRTALDLSGVDDIAEDSYVAKVDGMIAEQQAAWANKSDEYDSMMNQLRVQLVSLTQESRLASEKIEALKAQAKVQLQKEQMQAKVKLMKSEESAKSAEAILRTEIRKLQMQNSRLQSQIYTSKPSGGYGGGSCNTNILFPIPTPRDNNLVASPSPRSDANLRSSSKDFLRSSKDFNNCHESPSCHGSPHSYRSLSIVSPLSHKHLSPVQMQTPGSAQRSTNFSFNKSPMSVYSPFGDVASPGSKSDRENMVPPVIMSLR